MQILNGLLWVAGDPVGRLITTLTLYPLCFFFLFIFWYKSNTVQVRQQTLILNTCRRSVGGKAQYSFSAVRLHWSTVQCDFHTVCHLIIYTGFQYCTVRRLLFGTVSQCTGSQCTTLHSGLPSHGSKSQLSPLTSQPTSARIQFRARTPSTVIIIIISFSL